MQTKDYFYQGFGLALLKKKKFKDQIEICTNVEEWFWWLTILKNELTDNIKLTIIFFFILYYTILIEKTKEITEKRIV